MLEARIVSPRGSLHYSGESHPYDLEMLWEHVRDAGGRDIRLELVLDDDRIGPWISAWVHKVAAAGVRVEMLFMPQAAPT